MDNTTSEIASSHTPSTIARLPVFFTANLYHIDIDVSPKRKGFFGTLIISGKLSQASNTITLNARDMAVSDVVVTQKGQQLKGKVKQDISNEQIHLVFKRDKTKGTSTSKHNAALGKGLIEITLRFKGKLSTCMHGLYLAQDGGEKAIVSQCEAADARAIFPCLDEPEFKAKLKWIVRTDIPARLAKARRAPQLTVITNGIQRSARLETGRMVYRFAPTNPISTYLAALTIGYFDSSPTLDVNGTPCRSWAGLGKAEQTSFAQEVTAQVLPWYEKYFSHPYHYQKLDQVAVPGFDAGAMENIGAIFYRQSLLQMDPKTTSWGAQKRIAEVVAHEIAHQWFGNLVTMKWWDDLWLNEAFATWIAFKVVDDWKPKWRMWDDYAETKEDALAADALLNTHPIYTPVASPAQATELFDIITYEKGCAVLRMAEAYLGEKTFRTGIQHYIATHKNSNATGSDLWKSLEEVSKQPIGKLMKSWIFQSGFPLVSMKLGTRQGKSVITLQQQRFYADEHLQQQDNNQLWEIPLVVRYQTKDGKIKNKRLLFSSREETFVLPGGKIKWAYANAGGTGFFRQEFAPRDLNKLLTYALPNLSAAVRMNIIEDQWALVQNGHNSIDNFMELLTHFKGDADHIVLRSIASHLISLEQTLVAPKQRSKLAEFCRFMFADTLRTVGMKGTKQERPEVAVGRAALVAVLGRVGDDTELLDAACLLTEKEMVNPVSVNANLAPIVISLAAKHTSGTKNTLIKRYIAEFLKRKKEGATPQVQSRYLGALTYFESKKEISAILDATLDGTIPQEQLRAILVPMLGHRKSQKQTWEFLQQEWQQLAPKIGSMGLARLVESTGALSPSYQKEVTLFFQKNKIAEAERALKKALETMQLRKQLQKREGGNLRSWLEEWKD